MVDSILRLVWDNNKTCSGLTGILTITRDLTQQWYCFLPKPQRGNGNRERKLVQSVTWRVELSCLRPCVEGSAGGGRGGKLPFCPPSPPLVPSWVLTQSPGASSSQYHRDKPPPSALYPTQLPLQPPARQILTISTALANPGNHSLPTRATTSVGPRVNKSLT